MGILGSLFGKRKQVVVYRTIDGGHPAPYPDMTDEQLYNYEVTFNVPKRTFDKPPRPARPAAPPAEGTTIRCEPSVKHVMPRMPPAPEPSREPRLPPQPAQRTQPITERTQKNDALDESRPIQLPPLDLSKPVRMITTKQPVDIITTRARHPVYKVHAYIGNDDVVTLFTLDGQLTENGPRFLENVPQRQHLYLNIYPNPEQNGAERFLLTQHASRQEADAEAQPGRIACVPLQFDL